MLWIEIFFFSEKEEEYIKEEQKNIKYNMQRFLTSFVLHVSVSVSNFK